MARSEQAAAESPRGGDGPVAVRVAPAPGRAAVSLGSSLLVAVGTILPWQVIHFEDDRRSFRGWDLAAADARICLVLAAVGLLAAWSLTTVRGLAAALLGRLALLAAGGSAVGLAALQAVELRRNLDFPGLSTRPGLGLLAIGAGALGLVGAGAWAAWRPDRVAS